MPTPAHAHCFRFFTRPLALALSAAVMMPVVAENNAAENTGVLRDWRPYAELPESERQGIAPYCPGGFVDPMRLDDSIDPSRPDEEFPLVFHFDESDQLSTESAHLNGDVSAKRNTFEVYADEIRYERSSGEGELNGQVRLRSLGALIAGESALLDFETDEATINDAEFALHREDLHGSAQTLHRETLTLFRGENIAITRCMPEDPAWGIRAATLTVNQQTGIARAWHARFEIKSIPVLYVPYLSFPIDERRRSGFLPGTYGLGENGVNELAVPYYLNLAPNYDDTFTLHYFGELGLLARNEFRFLTENHSGITDLDVQVTQEAETTDGESAPRRWAYRQRLAGQMNDKTGYDLDTRWVSDSQYDQNFNNGGDSVNDQTLDLTVRRRIPTGLLTVDNEFTTPVQDGSSNFHTASIAASTRFGDLRTRLLTEFQVPEEENFLPGDPLDKDDWPLQRLPELSLTYQPLNLPGTLSPSGQLTASRISRQLTPQQEDALQNTGDASDLAAANETNRLFVRTGLSYPLGVEWGYARPQVDAFFLGYQQSNDLDADFSFADDDFERDPSIVTGRFTFDSRLVAEKPYRTNSGIIVHSIEPRLHYTYTPFVDQSDLPNLNTEAVDNDFKLFTNSRFSGLDRIGDMNRLSVAMDSRFRNNQSGEEVLFAGVSKGLKLSQERVTEDGTEAEDPDFEPEFSPTYLDSRWRPAEDVQVNASAQWAHDDGALEAYSADITYLPRGRRFLRLGITREDDAQGFGMSGYWPLRANIALVGHVNWARPVEDDEPYGDYENTDLVVGIDYDSCCWNVRVVGFSNQPDEDDEDEESTSLFSSRPERGVRFEFTLKGLGGSTGSIESLLADKVPGYQGRIHNYR